MICVVVDQPLTPGVKRIVDATFHALGQKWREVTLLPAMSEEEFKRSFNKDNLQETFAYGQKTLSKYVRKGDKVLLCGVHAIGIGLRLDRVPKISETRGLGLFLPSGHFGVLTINPRVFLKDIDLFRDFAFDVQKVVFQTAPQYEPQIEMLMAENKTEGRNLLRGILSGSTVVACDIETTGFSPITSKILAIGFARINPDATGYAVILPEKTLGPYIREEMERYEGKIVFQNGQFDYQHIWQAWGHTRPHEFWDTMLMHYTLDERPVNRYRNHGLKLLARVYFDAPDYDIDIGRWLEEYFRKDVGKVARRKYAVEWINKYPEKARHCWRNAYPDAEWRGRKVGREIPIEDVIPLVPLPRQMQPAPARTRKAEMWTQMLTYMGRDAYYTCRLYYSLVAEMREESQRLINYHCGTLSPLALALANMERTGIQMDVPYMQTVWDDLVRHLEEERDSIKTSVYAITGIEDFKPTSYPNVVKFLYSDEGLKLTPPKDAGRYAYKRKGKVTTNADTLKILSRQVAKTRPEASTLISKLVDFRQKSQLLSTYIVGIQDKIGPDGRLRGSFNIPGTATGRLSSSGPNLQNVPDASHVGYDVRKMYRATDGWTMIDADMSQLELRVAALFSQDEVLIEAYQNDADIHQEVAYMLWNKPKDEITKYERYLAKCMNFGVIYGRGAQSIATGPEMDNLVEMSGRKWSNREIDEYFDKFRVGYADLFAWMELIKEHCFDVRHVENPLGHRRRFDLIFGSNRAEIGRRIVNTPIQGFASQITCHAIIALDRILDPAEARVLFTVHDSIILEAKDNVAADIATLVKQTMESSLPKDVVCMFPTLDHAPFGIGDHIEYNLPFKADVKLGPNWGECYEDPETYVPYPMPDLETEEDADEDVVAVYG